MIIHDLEFINSFKEEDRKSDFAIRGGASASTTVSTSATDGAVYASASAVGAGDYSQAIATTRATLVNNQSYPGFGYTKGYGTGFGTAYGVDLYGTVASDRSISISIL